MSSFSVEDLEVDMSLVFYTNKKTSRQWIGLFQVFVRTKMIIQSATLNLMTPSLLSWLLRSARCPSH